MSKGVTKNAFQCDECGKFIPYRDFDAGLAKRVLITPDSHFSREEYETLCRECNRKEGVSEVKDWKDVSRALKAGIAAIEKRDALLREAANELNILIGYAQGLLIGAGKDPKNGNIDRAEATLSRIKQILGEE